MDAIGFGRAAVSGERPLVSGPQGRLYPSTAFIVSAVPEPEFAAESMDPHAKTQTRGSHEQDCSTSPGRRIAFPAAIAAIGLMAVALRAAAQPAAPGLPPAEAGRLADQLGALEEQSYAARRARDTGYWNDVLATRFVGWGPSGRIDKRAAVPLLGGVSCRIASHRLTDRQVTPLTRNAVLLTHRTEEVGQCNGKPVTPASYTATVYVREGGRWKIGFRAQSAIVDPMKATKPAGSDLWAGGATRTDASTRTLLAREQAVVTAWKDRDSARMAALFSQSLQFVDIFGSQIGNRADALKAWSGEGCDVKGFDLTGAKATMFAPDFGVLTYRGLFDGTCFGQALWPIWATAFYTRQGKDWLWSSGINVLAGAAAD